MLFGPAEKMHSVPLAYGWEEAWVSRRKNEESESCDRLTTGVTAPNLCCDPLFSDHFCHLQLRPPLAPLLPSDHSARALHHNWLMTPYQYLAVVTGFQYCCNLKWISVRLSTFPLAGSQWDELLITGSFLRECVTSERVCGCAHQFVFMWTAQAGHCPTGLMTPKMRKKAPVLPDGRRTNHTASWTTHRPSLSLCVFLGFLWR